MLDNRSPEENQSEIDAEEWVTIAKIQSVAEAGFFAHELEVQAEIPATIHSHENYNAIAGVWQNEFHLMVSGQHSERAIPILESWLATEVERDGYSVPYQDEFGFRKTPRPSRGLQPWLTSITIGSLAVAVATTVDLMPNARRAQVQPMKRERLWNQLNKSPEPWVQSDQQQGGIRVLRFDPETGAAFIDEDVNGDGVIDATIAID